MGFLKVMGVALFCWMVDGWDNAINHQIRGDFWDISSSPVIDGKDWIPTHSMVIYTFPSIWDDYICIYIYMHI